MATSPPESDAPIKPSQPDSSTLEDAKPSTSPVEMSDLQANTDAPASETKREEDTTAGAEQDTQTETTPQPPIKEEQPSSDTPTAPTTTTQPPTRPTRKPSEALGPATDLPITAPPPPSSTTGAILSITLMLTTGARHPYKIDEKYLKARKVDAASSGSDGTFDPREISGYKLKELIWTDWRSEWEPRPASPSSIRLIILGRLLEDKSPLKDFPFKLDDTNVVHMTVKPADFLDDDDTGGKKGHSIRGADGEERGAGCCRCVIL